MSGIVSTVVCLSILAIACGAFFMELGEQKEQNLLKHCKNVRDRAIYSCNTLPNPEGLKACADAIGSLEGIEASATIWRVEVVTSTALALLVVAAVFCKASATVLFIMTTVAAIALARYQRSYEHSHIMSHMRETRRQLIRALQGLPDARHTFYA